jgi:hypothetical protein
MVGQILIWESNSQKRAQLQVLFCPGGTTRDNVAAFSLNHKMLQSDSELPNGP